MAIAKFHFTCDRCGHVGPEYEPMWECRECISDVCDECIVPGTQDEERGTALCRHCQAENEAEEAARHGQDHTTGNAG